MTDGKNRNLKIAKCYLENVVSIKEIDQDGDISDVSEGGWGFNFKLPVRIRIFLEQKL